MHVAGLSTPEYFKRFIVIVILYRLHVPFRLTPLFPPPETPSPCVHQIHAIQEIPLTNPNNISLTLKALTFCNQFDVAVFETTRQQGIYN